MSAFKILCLQCSDQVWARHSSSTSVGAAAQPGGPATRVGPGRAVEVAQRPHLLERQREQPIPGELLAGASSGSSRLTVSTGRAACSTTRGTERSGGEAFHCAYGWTPTRSITSLASRALAIRPASASETPSSR